MVCNNGYPWHHGHRSSRRPNLVLCLLTPHVYSRFFSLDHDDLLNSSILSSLPPLLLIQYLLFLSFYKSSIASLSGLRPQRCCVIDYRRRVFCTATIQQNGFPTPHSNDTRQQRRQPSSLRTTQTTQCKYRIKPGHISNQHEWNLYATGNTKTNQETRSILRSWTSSTMCDSLFRFLWLDAVPATNWIGNAIILKF